MKLYFDPVSTTSRIVTFFLHDHQLHFDERIVSVLAGEQRLPELIAINPSAQVPVLVDDDGFTLTESSAIIRYLAQKHRLAAYPDDAQRRARVDEAISWLQTNFHVYHGVLLAYTYVIPSLTSMDPKVLSAIRAVGQKGSDRYMRILNDDMIGSWPYIGGGRISLADYVGAANVTLGSICGLDLTPYPNVARWLDTLRARKGWDKAYAAFEAMIASQVPEAPRLRA